MALKPQLNKVIMLALILIFSFSGNIRADSDKHAARKEKSHTDRIANRPLNQKATADALMAEKGLENFKKALEIYQELAAKDSNSFEIHWKCAKACREYGYQAQKSGLDNWQVICAEYGKKGMHYAEAAIRLAPEQPHGHLFYGVNVGIYSDAVSVFTALREGLKDKTLNSLQKAYEIDKTLERGGPILGLGRFWHMVPWPYKDKDKALAYYREYQQSPFFGKRIEGHIFLAELLMEKWGHEHKKEARKLLEAALAQTDEPYWQRRAKDLLNEI